MRYFFVGICSSARATTTKHQTACGLNNRHLSLTELETKQSKIKVPEYLVPGERPIPGLQMTTLSLCPHMGKRERALFSLPLFTKTLIYHGGSTLMTSSQPNHLPKVITQGISTSIYEYGGHKYSVHYSRHLLKLRVLVFVMYNDKFLQLEGTNVKNIY